MTGARRALRALWLAALVAACAGGPAPAPGAAAPAGPVPGVSGAAGWSGLVILVRHAEAEHEPGGDPELTAAGRARAERLGALLRDAGIEAVHASPYHRTRQTAAPVAAALGVGVSEYDPRRLADLADRLRRTGGRHLVVGHSNSTPQLAALLGGDAGAAMEEWEHDRVYVLVPVEGGAAVRTLILRY